MWYGNVALNIRNFGMAQCLWWFVATRGMTDHFRVPFIPQTTGSDEFCRKFAEAFHLKYVA